MRTVFADSFSFFALLNPTEGNPSEPNFSQK
jgi:hypothetical protein